MDALTCEELVIALMVGSVPWVTVPLSARYAVDTSWLGGVKERLVPFIVPWRMGLSCSESASAKIIMYPNWFTLPCPPVMGYDVEPILMDPVAF